MSQWDPNGHLSHHVEYIPQSTKAAHYATDPRYTTDVTSPCTIAKHNYTPSIGERLQQMAQVINVNDLSTASGMRLPSSQAPPAPSVFNSWIYSFDTHISTRYVWSQSSQWTKCSFRSTIHNFKCITEITHVRTEQNYATAHPDGPGHCKLATTQSSSYGECVETTSRSFWSSSSSYRAEET